MTELVAFTQERKQCGARGWFFDRAVGDWQRHRCERQSLHSGKHSYHPPHHATIYFDDSTRNVIESPAAHQEER